MPTFDTPEPISATLELGVGDVTIVAEDRVDTVVEVRPTDPAKRSDVAAAEQTRVEHSPGRLLVKAPKGWRQFSFRGGSESIDLLVTLPAGSDVQLDAGVATVRVAGCLGECRVKLGAGHIRVESATPARLRSGAGDITLDRSVGHTDVSTGSGTIQVGEIEGTAVVKNSNGDTWIGEVTGDLTAHGSNGRITVDRSHAAVAVRSANGDLRLGEGVGGPVVAQTAYGAIDIGLRAGVAAWLDLDTGFGRVRNDLEAAPAPGPDDDTVEVKARTAFGDITVRRSAPVDSDQGVPS